MNELKFEVFNKTGEILRARFVRPINLMDNSPVVIMLTGDGPKGSNSPSWANIAPRLASLGITSLLFDFSGLGNSDGKRENLTLSKGIDDFSIIFEEIKHYSWIDPNKVAIMASSFGACVALMCPSILNKCKAIGLKSPSTFLPDAYFNELTIEQFSEWNKTGFCEENGYRLSVFIDPFQYNVYAEVPKIKTKCLITHGNTDEVVPYQQSLYLKELMGGEVELITFADGDHGYSGDKWEKMANIFENFYKNELL